MSSKHRLKKVLLPCGKEVETLKQNFIKEQANLPGPSDTYSKISLFVIALFLHQAGILHAASRGVSGGGFSLCFLFFLSSSSLLPTCTHLHITFDIAQPWFWLGCLNSTAKTHTSLLCSDFSSQKIFEGLIRLFIPSPCLTAQRKEGKQGDPSPGHLPAPA